MAPAPDPKPDAERERGGYGDARTDSDAVLALPDAGDHERSGILMSVSGMRGRGVRSELNDGAEASERSMIPAIPESSLISDSCGGLIRKLAGGMGGVVWAVVRW